MKQVIVKCPCCQQRALPFYMSTAPSPIRGRVVGVLAKAGMTPKEIAEALGWKRSTVRSMQTYWRHYSKVAP